MAFAVVLLQFQEAASCPFCESDQGAAVHAGIFSDLFWSTFGSILAPWLILSAAVIWLPTRLTRRRD
jgi:hypothetical protein